MKERPILFSSPMVRAILDGSKTQTRRIVKPQPPSTALRVSHVANEQSILAGAWVAEMADGTINTPQPCLYGEPGDRLWVRETMRRDENGTWHYSADEAIVVIRPEQRTPANLDALHAWTKRKGDTCVSIHMPRWASRITLDVTSIRVERLHDITEEDARAEGVESVDWSAFPDSYDTAREAFAALWKSINGTESWDANPWVWVVGFKPVRP